jgi:hypothetical protein
MTNIAHPLGELLVFANGKYVNAFFDTNVWQYIRYCGDESETEQIAVLIECLSDVPELAIMEIYLFQVLEHQAAEHARSALAGYWQSPDQSPYGDFLAKAQPPVLQPATKICPKMSFRKNYNGFGFDISGTGHVRFLGPVNGITGAPFDVNIFACVVDGKLTPLYQGVKRRSGKPTSVEQLEQVWSEMERRFLKAMQSEPYLMSKMENARVATLAFAERMRPAMAPRFSDAIMAARHKNDLPDDLLHGKLNAIGLEGITRLSASPRTSNATPQVRSDELTLVALSINDIIFENAVSWNASPNMWNWRRQLSSQIAHKQIIEIADVINELHSQFKSRSDAAPIDPSFVKRILQEFDFSNPGSDSPKLRAGLAAVEEVAMEYFGNTVQNCHSL